MMRNRCSDHGVEDSAGHLSALKPGWDGGVERGEEVHLSVTLCWVL